MVTFSFLAQKGNNAIRIAVGGISHETSSFAATRTTIADFESGFGLFRGPEIIQRFTGSNICTGGFIDGGKAHGFEVVPLLWCFAYPRGLIIRDRLTGWTTLSGQPIEVFHRYPFLGVSSVRLTETLTRSLKGRTQWLTGRFFSSLRGKHGKPFVFLR